jgi:CheY-like chemotaxis protein
VTSPPDAPNRYVCAPDLVIADIRMPPTRIEEGLEAARAMIDRALVHEIVSAQ